MTYMAYTIFSVSELWFTVYLINVSSSPSLFFLSDLCPRWHNKNVKLRMLSLVIHFIHKMLLFYDFSWPLPSLFPLYTYLFHLPAIFLFLRLFLCVCGTFVETDDDDIPNARGVRGFTKCST